MPSPGGSHALARRFPCTELTTIAIPVRPATDAAPSSIEASSRACWDRQRSPNWILVTYISTSTDARRSTCRTCIYSRTDGIVSWPACAESLGRRRENIEIMGSHLGMTNNPAALIAVVDRLAQPVDRWRKFASPPALSWLYPTARYWTAGPGHAQVRH